MEPCCSFERGLGAVHCGAVCSHVPPATGCLLVALRRSPTGTSAWTQRTAAHVAHGVGGSSPPPPGHQLSRQRGAPALPRLITVGPGRKHHAPKPAARIPPYLLTRRWLTTRLTTFASLTGRAAWVPLARAGGHTGLGKTVRSGFTRCGKYSGTGADTWARTPRLASRGRPPRGCDGRSVHAVSYAKRSRSSPLTAEQLPPSSGG